MNKLKHKKSFLLVGALLVSLAAVMALWAVRRHTLRLSKTVAARPTGERMANLPRIILWAWERPERLDFIETREVGVAFLAKTLYLRGQRVVVRPRFQPLSVPPETQLVAVARIESDHLDQPALNAAQAARLSSEIAELARLPKVVAVQIDFDARQTERNFYRQGLIELRRQLPASTALSITALASWCSYDDWLAGLPVDEAVPMLFRMGIDRRQILSRLESDGEFRSSICRSSVGTSTDEPLVHMPASPRTYVF